MFTPTNLTAILESISGPVFCTSLGLNELPSNCAIKHGDGLACRRLGMFIVNRLLFSLLPSIIPNLEKMTNTCETYHEKMCLLV